MTSEVWGRWPETRFVEWVMRKYGTAEDRSKIKFLELGAGGGAQMRFLCDEGFDAWGIEATDAGFAACRNLAPHAKMLKGDLTLWDPLSVQFDCVFDICTMQHLDPVEARVALQRIHKWIKPGGAFFSMWASPENAHEGLDTPASYALKPTEMATTFNGFRLIKAGMQAIKVEPDTQSTRSHWILEWQKMGP